MSNYSSPDFTPQQIVAYLADLEVAAVNPEDIDRPSFEFVCSIFSSLMSYLDPLGAEDREHIDFESLIGLENPEYHVDSTKIFNFYHNVNDTLALIGLDIGLRDLLRPDRGKTKGILSAVVNFLIHRDEKLVKLLPIVEQSNQAKERHEKLESRISELKREIAEHEKVCELEHPYVEEVEAEVSGLRQRVHEFNKEQASQKAQFKQIKENIESINDKTSQADFELLETAQENSKLLARIVQSPDKLQKTLEEKKAKRAEVKNAEKSLMLSVNTKADKHEIYTKACEKITKHLSQLQNLQEQVNAAKAIDKEVKTLKKNISDEELSIVSVDLKINELKDRSKEAEGLIKEMERDRDLCIAEQTQKLNIVKSETEQKLRELNQREEKAKAKFLKGESLLLKVASIQEAVKQKQLELNAKTEEVVNAFRCYAARFDPFLERAKTEANNVGPQLHVS